MTPIAKQLESYRTAKRIVSACNRMKVGQGQALKWCANQREVLIWMCRMTKKQMEKRNA